MSDNNQGVFDRETPDREAHRARSRRYVEEEFADIEWLMSQRTGRRFIHRLLERSGVFHSTFDESPGRTAFAEGARSIGLQYLQMVQTVGLDEYVSMLKEARDDDRADRE